VISRDPVVSVLIPARDEEDTLPSCLVSVARQTLRRWECVVVDDGSRDSTPEIVDRFRGRDPRFRLVRGSGTGLVEALRTGVSACQGRIVARMDADDLMRRDRLELQIAALSGTRPPDAVGTHVRYWPRADLGRGSHEYESWLNSIRSEDDVRREAFIECPVAHPTLMIRRDLLARYGYRDCGWPEDYDLVLRLLEDGRRVGVVPRRLLQWRLRPEGLSRRHPSYRLDRFTACKAHFLSRTFLGQSADYVLWGYGRTGRTLHGALNACGRKPRKIVETHPGRVGQTIHGAPVVLPDDIRPGRDAPLVVSVAREIHRRRIRGFLAAREWVELRDFVCAA